MLPWQWEPQRHVTRIKQKLFLEEWAIAVGAVRGELGACGRRVIEEWWVDDTGGVDARRRHRGEGRAREAWRRGDGRRIAAQARRARLRGERWERERAQARWGGRRAL